MVNQETVQQDSFNNKKNIIKNNIISAYGHVFPSNLKEINLGTVEEYCQVINKNLSPSQLNDADLNLEINSMFEFYRLPQTMGNFYKGCLDKDVTSFEIREVILEIFIASIIYLKRYEITTIQTLKEAPNFNEFIEDSSFVISEDEKEFLTFNNVSFEQLQQLNQFDDNQEIMFSNIWVNAEKAVKNRVNSIEHTAQINGKEFFEYLLAQKSSDIVPLALKILSKIELTNNEIKFLIYLICYFESRLRFINDAQKDHQQGNIYACKYEIHILDQKIKELRSTNIFKDLDNKFQSQIEKELQDSDDIKFLNSHQDVVNNIINGFLIQLMQIQSNYKLKDQQFEIEKALKQQQLFEILKKIIVKENLQIDILDKLFSQILEEALPKIMGLNDYASSYQDIVYSSMEEFINITKDLKSFKKRFYIEEFNKLQQLLIANLQNFKIYSEDLTNKQKYFSLLVKFDNSFISIFLGSMNRKEYNISSFFTNFITILIYAGLIFTQPLINIFYYKKHEKILYSLHYLYKNNIANYPIKPLITYIKDLALLLIPRIIVCIINIPIMISKYIVLFFNRNTRELKNNISVNGISDKKNLTFVARIGKDIIFPIVSAFIILLTSSKIFSIITPINYNIQNLPEKNFQFNFTKIAIFLLSNTIIEEIFCHVYNFLPQKAQHYISYILPYYEGAEKDFPQADTFIQQVSDQKDLIQNYKPSCFGLREFERQINTQYNSSQIF